MQHILFQQDIAFHLFQLLIFGEMFMRLLEKLSASARWVLNWARRPVSARRFTVSFVAAFGAIFLLWTLLVFWVDPYIYYHRGWGLKNVFSNPLARIPGVMRTFEFDTVLFGSSMCQNFKRSEIDAALHVRSVKATAPGMNSDMFNQFFETAWRSRGDKLTRCLLGVDFIGFARERENTNYSYLYKDRIFPCEYFYSLDTVEAIVDVFITNISAPYNRISRHQIDEDVMFSNKPRLKYNRELLEENVREWTSDLSLSPARTIENFDMHLFVHVRNHPEIQFDLFLPPYNIYFWCMMRDQGNLEDHLELRNVFARMAAEYPNVRVYDFQAEFDIVGSFDVYRDMTHYSPDINSRIIKDIGEGKHVFTQEEFRRRTALIESRSAELQPAFDELRRKAP